MTLHDDLRANADVVLALAAGLETMIGRETLVTIGQPRRKINDVVPDADARVVTLEFDLSDGSAGVLALVATPAFARTLEAASADEVLVTAVAPALVAAASALATLTTFNIDVAADDAHEAPLAAAVAGFGDDSVVFPLLEGAEPIACMAITTGVPDPTRADRLAGPVADETEPGGGASDASFVLADVEVGVTAELGRAHMTVRELLSITPGAVVDLDRSVGTPVDLLVNGTAIARGEVVVIEEEFGVRITEILAR